MNLRVLYEDTNVICVDKPAGFHVHPPEDARHRISRKFNCLYLLRRQIERPLYPVHRLDRPTSGVLIYALSSEAARLVAQQFRNQETRKRYICLVRGWTDDHFEMDNEDGRTRFTTLHRSEHPFAISRYPTSRYSLVEARPETGRYHQIRKHLKTLRHPIIGDKVRGDRYHNRYFRDELQMPGLFLKAHQIGFVSPDQEKYIEVRSRWNHSWHRIFDFMNFCPL